MAVVAAPKASEAAGAAQEAAAQQLKGAGAPAAPSEQLEEPGFVVRTAQGPKQHRPACKCVQCRFQRRQWLAGQPDSCAMLGASLLAPAGPSPSLPTPEGQLGLPSMADAALPASASPLSGLLAELGSSLSDSPPAKVCTRRQASPPLHYLVECCACPPPCR